VNITAQAFVSPEQVKGLIRVVDGDPAEAGEKSFKLLV